MEATSKEPATYRDLLMLPPDQQGQIFNGELVISPRPPLRHNLLSSLLGRELWETFDRGRGGPGGWWIMEEPVIQVDENILVADLCGWRRSRLEAFPRMLPEPTPPDWVGEVLWPGATAMDRVRKLPLYARAGVSSLWLMDAVERTLEVFRLADGHWSMVAGFVGSGTVRAEPFDAVELHLERLWRSVER